MTVGIVELAGRAEQLHNEWHLKQRVASFVLG